MDLIFVRRPGARIVEFKARRLDAFICKYALAGTTTKSRRKQVSGYELIKLR
jgi:hypothetical protein